MKLKEKIIEGVLFLCGSIGVLTTLGIVYVLFSESIDFFSKVSIIDFLTDKQWTPLFDEKHFGILPLVNYIIYFLLSISIQNQSNLKFPCFTV